MDSLNQFIDSTYAYGNTGSSIANSVSAGAQQAQMNFNAEQATLAFERQKELAGIQAAYNSAAAAEQREYNKQMWAEQVRVNRENMEAQQAFNHAEAILQREFNAAEAEKGRNWSTDEAEKQRVFNKAEAALAREFSSDEALAVREWQERLSNTQYQRAVADMKAAGINPILAAGAHATTPSGAMAQSSSASSGMASSGIASGSAATSGLANSSMASTGMESLSQASVAHANAGNYTGQGNNMSENLAMLGAVASMFGEGMSGLATAFQNIGDNINLVKFAGALGEVLNGKEGKESAKELVGGIQGDIEHVTQEWDRTFTGGLIGEFRDMFSQWGRMFQGKTGGGAGHHF